MSDCYKHKNIPNHNVHCTNCQTVYCGRCNTKCPVCGNQSRVIAK